MGTTDRDDVAAATPGPARHVWPVVVLGGIAAAIHIWKLPPFVAELGIAYGVSLTEVGVLLGTVQLAGMLGGFAAGVVAESFGLRRSMVTGLLVLTIASVVAAFLPPFGVMLALRGVESFGLLLTIVSGPGLIRRETAHELLGFATGAWSGFQGTAALAALSFAAVAVGWATVPGTWFAAAGCSLLAAFALVLVVPADPRGRVTQAGAEQGVWHRVARTARAWRVWVNGLVFMLYGGVWMAVLGFLPTILGGAGLSPALANLTTGIACGINVVGNLVAGRLLQRGTPPGILIAIGSAVMGVTGVVVFALGLGPWWQFAGVLVFSMVGGLVPAALFRLALAVTPRDGSASAGVGVAIQGSNLGAFVAVPAVAALATATGSWAATAWLAAGAAALAVALGLLLRDPTSPPRRWA